MKNYLRYGFYALALIIMSCEKHKDVDKNLTKETEKDTTVFTFLDDDIIRNLANREDSTTWDLKLFKKDLEGVDNKYGPFSSGAFPVPTYDFFGEGNYRNPEAFSYNGGYQSVLKVENKILFSTNFFITKGLLNEHYLKEKDNIVFFQIVVLTDLIDWEEFGHLKPLELSRNHPDYFGQGSYKTKNNQIDFSAFATHDGDSYAIVNTRLFDLTKGKTILIAPQKDRSLRSMQIDSPELSSEQIDQYLKGLLKEEKIVKFFTSKESI